MKKILKSILPQEPIELLVILVILAMGGAFITGCSKDDKSNVPEIEVMNTIKSVIKVTLPDRPSDFSTTKYMNIGEVCLNGFVYYIGKSTKLAVMAPKHISPNTIQICKEKDNEYLRTN